MNKITQLIELLSNNTLLRSKIKEMEYLEYQEVVINKSFKRFLKLALFTKEFGENFINYWLKRKNSLSFIIFVIIFIYGNKDRQNNIKAKKSLSPNIIWTVIAVFIYVPCWLQIIGGNFFRVVAFTDPKLAINIISEIAYPLYIMNMVENYFFMKMSFETIYSLSLYFGLKYYMKELWDIHKGKRTFKFLTYIEIPMFVKYHMYYAAVVETIFESLKWGFDNIFKFVVSFFPMSTRLMFTLSYESIWVSLLVIVTGYGFWKAAKGISFTNDGLIDDLVRIHLGAECLNPLEDWQDYGMDNYKDKYY